MHSTRNQQLRERKEDRRREEDEKKNEIEFLNRNNTITQIRNFFFIFVCPFGKKRERIRTSSVAHFEHYNKEKQTNFYLFFFVFERKCVFVFLYVGDGEATTSKSRRRDEE